MKGSKGARGLGPQAAPSPRLRWFALAALASLLGCQRCGGAAPSASIDGSAPLEAAPEGSASAATMGALPAPAVDVPEVRDTGPGRATAALRAVLQAYGIAFDAAVLERDCKVDDEGASIDDVEDTAVKYGLDAAQIIVPAEHVLLPEAKMLPALVVADGPDDAQDFIVAWRLDGDRVEIMSPGEGRSWVARAELQKTLHFHEMTMQADDLRAAMASQPFRDALRARMEGLGIAQGPASALLDQAAADPSFRSFAALDAALRQLEADPARPVGDAGARLAASFACSSGAREAGPGFGAARGPIATGGRCEGVEPVPPALWWAHPTLKGPDGAAQVQVRGVVMIAIAGRHAGAAP
jgi:Peptidase C39 family